MSLSGRSTLKKFYLPDVTFNRHCIACSSISNRRFVPFWHWLNSKMIKMKSKTLGNQSNTHVKTEISFKSENKKSAFWKMHIIQMSVRKPVIYLPSQPCSPSCILFSTKLRKRSILYALLCFGQIQLYFYSSIFSFSTLPPNKTVLIKVLLKPSHA